MILWVRQCINHPPVITIFVGGINHSQMDGLLFFQPQYLIFWVMFLFKELFVFSHVFLFFQSGALFIAICYILEQTPHFVEFWS